MSDATVIALTFWSAVSLISLTFLLFAVILGLRAMHIYWTLRRERELDFWRPVFVQCSMEMPEEVPRLEGPDSYAVVALWDYFREFLRGSCSERLNRVAEEAGFVDAARDMLDSRSIRIRLLGIATVGNLHDPESWDPLLALVSDESPYVSMAAMRSLMRIDAHRAMPLLIEKIQDREDWPTSKLITILREAGTATVSGSIAKALTTAPPKTQRQLLLFLETGDPSVALPAIRELLLQTEDAEVMITAMNVIAKLADPRGLKLARAHTSHADWRVRVHAVRALGIALYLSDDVESSIERLEAAFDSEGDALYFVAAWYLANAYLRAGRVDDAIGLIDDLRELAAPGDDAWIDRAYALYDEIQAER